VDSGQLDELLQSSTKVTVVDIRDESRFQHGHIPNAINIPERVLELKQLPPLGYVVVYGQGLGTENMTEAARILNEKPGIKAEVLEGGYVGWEMSKGNTTQAAGLQGEVLNVISYQSLQELQSEDEIILVDLRTPPVVQKEPGVLTRQGVAPPVAALTSLSEKFPGMSVVKSPFDAPGVLRSGQMARQSSTATVTPLMVLIDNGDGEAQKMARILNANGVRRVVILAGGEKILERDGAPGLQRMGMGSQVVEIGDAE
jgi:rhodanese-related sulfurtransferase